MMRSGVIAKKLGMTRLFLEDGKQIPVTVLQMDNVQVVAQRTSDKDGYSAVQLGAGTAKAKNVSKPMRGHYAAAKAGMVGMSKSLAYEVASRGITVDAVAPGRFRVVVQTAASQQEVEFTTPNGTREFTTKVELSEPVAVVCSIDTSALRGAQLPADFAGFLVALRPQHENSYSLDASGQRSNLTKNTGWIRLGKSEQFRLERVTPGLPRKLEILGGAVVGEAWFTGQPGQTARVTLRPEVGGTLLLLGPSSLPAGDVELDCKSGDGIWRPVHHGPTASRLRVRRPSGSVQWRVRHWPNDRSTDEQFGEWTGTAVVPADGGAVEVRWGG